MADDQQRPAPRPAHARSQDQESHEPDDRQENSEERAANESDADGEGADDGRGREEHGAKARVRWEDESGKRDAGKHDTEAGESSGPISGEQDRDEDGSTGCDTDQRDQDGPESDQHDAKTRPREGEKKDEDREPPPPPPGKRVFVIVGAVVAVLIVFGGVGHFLQFQRADAMHHQMTQEAPTIQTQRAKRVDGPVDTTLPGQTLAFDTATMYARATGYIADRRVDIGSVVHKGDLLVRISAPDTDQQLAQAEAQLLQNQASLFQAQSNLKSSNASSKLAKVTQYRQTTLAAEGWATQQNADQSRENFSVQTESVSQAQAGIRSAQANIAAQYANIQRLQALVGFEQIRAPFDGVVTVRNVDTGDLVTADQNGGTPMFSLDRTDVIRVQAYVPQSDAVGIKDGLPADVSVPEIPGRIFHGKIARSSVSLTQNARTLLVEVDVPNQDGALRAGLFANVTFHVPRSHPGVMIPDEAMVFDQTGLHVLTVQKDNTVKAVPITIYRDFGTSAELRDGLSGDENLVVNPPADLSNGSKIKIEAAGKEQH